MPGRSSYDYALLRVTPDVERGECVNVGVILICRQRRYLGMRVAVDEARLLALAPDLDLALVRDYLSGLERICAGDTEAGPIAELSQAERFHWLVSPASGIIQPSPVHTGLCDSPEPTLERLFTRLVLAYGD